MPSGYSHLARWLPRRASLILATVSLLAVVIFHASLLHVAASFLVSGDDVTNGEYIVVLGGDGVYDEAARLINDAEWRQILIVQMRATRLTELGIVPPADDVAFRELQSRGIPRDRVEVIAGTASNDWEIVRQLVSRLELEQASESLILCDRFSSRRLRRIIQAVTSPEQAERISIAPLPDRRYDETNWWKSRTGAKQFCTHWGNNLLLTIIGERQCQDSTWDPDEYEKELAIRVAAADERRD